MNGAQVRPDALRGEIGQTRAELGQTVQELAARVDVPSRVRAGAAHTMARVHRAGRNPVPWLVLAGSAALGTLVTVVLSAWPRRRRGARWRRR